MVFYLSPLSNPSPPPIHVYIIQRPQCWISRLAFNLEAVSIKTHIGQWWWSFICLPPSDRAPVSRNTISQYSTGASPPLKAGHREIPPHLTTTCSRFNTLARRSTRPSAGPERSQLLRILPSLTVRKFFSASAYFFLLRQHWRKPSFFHVPMSLYVPRF
jgi:hypothetical protein